MMKSTSNLELMNPTNDEEISQNSVHHSLRVNWDNIVKRFENEFSKTFSKSKKAHFDCLPKEYKVVDGARVRWFPLLLLDAMIFVLHNNFFRFATRRAFNQLEILYNCILEEIQSIDPGFYDELKKLMYQEALSWPVQNSPVIYDDMPKEEQELVLAREEDNNLTISFDCAKKFSNLEIENINFPWNSIEALKNHVVQDPPSKSKQKFLVIIDYLSRHHSFAHPEYSFHEILRAVVCKVLAYFGSNRCELMPMILESKAAAALPKRASTPTEIPIQSSISNDSAKLSPTNNNTTVIARQQIKRKKFLHKQKKVKGKQVLNGFERPQVAYSTYPSAHSFAKSKICFPMMGKGKFGAIGGATMFGEGSQEEYMINPFLFEDQEMGRQDFHQQFLNHSSDSFHSRHHSLSGDKAGFNRMASNSISSSHGSASDYPQLSSDSWDTMMRENNGHSYSSNYFNVSGDSGEGLNKIALSSSISWSSDAINGEGSYRQGKDSASTSSSNQQNDGPKENGCDEIKQDDQLMDAMQQRHRDAASSAPKFPQLNVRIDKYDFPSSRWNQAPMENDKPPESFGNRGYYPGYQYGYPPIYQVNTVTPTDYQMPVKKINGNLPPPHPSSSSASSSPAHHSVMSNRPYYCHPPLPPSAQEFPATANQFRVVHVLSPQHQQAGVAAGQSMYTSPILMENNASNRMAASPSMKGMSEGGKMVSSSPYMPPSSPSHFAGTVNPSANGHYQQHLAANNGLSQKMFEQSI